jgi:predicted HD superfamily hydrolase involved in NAD metabolism
MNSITEKVIVFLKKRLDSAKYKHTLGVMRTAKALALRHGVSSQDAELAAALHDLGRIMNRTQLAKYAVKHRIRAPFIGDMIKNNPALLHGAAGAHFASKKFGLHDKKTVLDAAAFHTAAKPGMSRLAKLIYVADYVAPDRRFPGVDRVRKLALRDLDGAFRAALGNKLLHVIGKKKWLHPGAVAAYNEALE